ncbi:hypothetical protein [Mucilaginibacter sp. OK098]|uniref:hypothetical protein n=1 Tax=Mucilaginibacter sp. OK098 TaxID=1855297 RepID=UPI0009345068|nr:hypothetical protein [Mucilaginibacter sp. OK098]
MYKCKGQGRLCEIYFPLPIADLAGPVSQLDCLGLGDFHDAMRAARQAPAFVRMVRIGRPALADVHGINPCFCKRNDCR